MVPAASYLDERSENMGHIHHWDVDDSLVGQCRQCPEQRTFERKPTRQLPRDETPITPSDYWDIAQNIARHHKDQEDVQQECFLALWEARPATKGLATVIARRQAVDYWRKVYARANATVALSEVIGEGEDITWSDVIEDPAAEASLLARAMLRMLPANVLRIAARKLAGKALCSSERMALLRFRKAAAA